MTGTNQPTTKRESGNVLFLILIAVALFAALSYAVTSSTRSGGSTTEGEKALLGSASLTQYPTALRTSIVRMILNGHDVRLIKFDVPGSDAYDTASSNLRVFHPDGGGAVHQTAQSTVMATGNPGRWYHNANFRVPHIGRDTGDGLANDLIAFMPGVSAITCARVNQEMGIKEDACTSTQGGVPIVTLGANVLQDIDDENEFPVNTAGTPIECDNAFNNKATGCFYDSSLAVGGVTGHYVFYSVILER